MAAEHRFRSMASAVHVIAVGATSGIFAQVESRVHQLEGKWSRFLADSEVSQLAKAADEWVNVSLDTIVLVETMQLAHRITEGRYDPTMVHEIVNLGYGNSIDDASQLSFTIDLPSIGRSVQDFIVDRSAQTIYAPAGIALDPGGVGKGLAADLVVTEMLEDGTEGLLLSIGGDIAASGTPPTSEGWHIDVGNPYDRSETLRSIVLSGGGCATSSTQTRRWKQDGQSRHHILDPQHRGTSQTDLASATVITTAGWRAEVFATAALLEASNGFVEYLTSHELTGMALVTSGQQLHTPEFAVPILEASGATT